VICPRCGERAYVVQSICDGDRVFRRRRCAQNHWLVSVELVPHDPERVKAVERGMSRLETAKQGKGRARG
jgi:hypothetical protein